MTASPAWSQSLLKSLDPDNDGTVDLAEAKAAASKVFDKLDGDHDGTLDKDEYLADVEQRLRKPIQTTTARSMRRS